MNAGLRVIKPGILSLYQDCGRYGSHHLGLTNGGPMDQQAFRWSNRLCDNRGSFTTLEIAAGGLVLQAETDTIIAVTGADNTLTINKNSAAIWCSHQVRHGDHIALGYPHQGVYNYLAVAGGFEAKPLFGSTAAVPREKIGGHHGNGSAIAAGDLLHCQPTASVENLYALCKELQPKRPHKSVLLRVILGCQQDAFTPTQKQVFFSHHYQITQQKDRMGCRLHGPDIAPPNCTMLSEGISLGAVQIPPDGQPIILMRDRQTIGGYPKLGSIFSADLDQLAQLTAGDTVQFTPITLEHAHNLLHLNEQRFLTTLPHALS